jgi:preprotein translocase subunit SecA
MNFEIRKNVLKYDEVMDKQRQIIYAERRRILLGEDLQDQTLELITDVIESAVSENANPDLPPEDWDWEQLISRIHEIHPSRLSAEDFDPETVTYDEVVEAFLTEAVDSYNARENELGTDRLREIERLVLLSVIDNRWRDHLYEMDYLQEGIGLRAMAQRDPLVEYQREGFEMFGRMQHAIKEDFARYIFHIEAVQEEGRRAPEPTRLREERRAVPLTRVSPGPNGDLGADAGRAEAEDGPIEVQQAVSEKIPRNAPCPCGSGKKYKLCHGRPGAMALPSDHSSESSG